MSPPLTHPKRSPDLYLSGPSFQAIGDLNAETIPIKPRAPLLSSPRLCRVLARFPCAPRPVHRKAPLKVPFHPLGNISNLVRVGREPVLPVSGNNPDFRYYRSLRISPQLLLAFAMKVPAFVLLLTRFSFFPSLSCNPWWMRLDLFFLFLRPPRLVPCSPFFGFAFLFFMTRWVPVFLPPSPQEWRVPLY